MTEAPGPTPPAPPRPAGEFPAELRAWRDGGRFAGVDGVDLFFRAEGTGPWLVCFHGFPTSSWDWHLVLPLLTPHRRVLVFDFPGYGLSAKPPGRDYSLLRQCDAALGLLQRLGVGEADLLSHDMGNSVACELAWRLEQGSCPLRLRSWTLLNGGVYMDLHRPLLTQRLLRTPLLGPLVARTSTWAVFRRQYPRVYAHPGRFDEAHYRAQWALMRHNGGRRVLAALAGYMRERTRRGERWLGPLHRCRVPMRALWGRRDPIAVPAIADRLKSRNPAVELTWLDDTGHYPQLENPAAVAAGVLAAAEPRATGTPAQNG